MKRKRPLCCCIYVTFVVCARQGLNKTPQIEMGFRDNELYGLISLCSAFHVYKLDIVLQIMISYTYL